MISWVACFDEMVKLAFASPYLAQHQRFQGQMNQFLKTLQEKKWSKPNLFGERSKRPRLNIYFPQTGGRP